MVALVDWAVGEIRAQLEEQGLMDDTLFVFLSDNGWSIGRPSKLTPYEKGRRTHMVFSFPGRIAEGRRIDELVSTMDLYPTLLDYAGAPIPERTVGKSLRPVLEGQAPPTTITTMGAVYRNVASNDGKNPSDDLVALYLRDEKFKFVYYVRELRPPRDTWIHIRDVPSVPSGTIQLFNLDHDPREMFNLAGFKRHKERLDRYRAQVLAWWKETGGGPLPVIDVTPLERNTAPSS